MKIIGLLLKSFSFILLIAFITSCYSTQKNDFRMKLNVLSNPDYYFAKIAENPNKQLINLEDFIPGIVLDIRYATKNNFTNEVIYKAPKAYVRKPVAEALAKVQSELKTKGLGLKIFDAYRPYSATERFYEVYPDTNFVAAPWKGSVHNRACAVDLTIVNLETGQELEMPTPFDEFTVKAGHSFLELSEQVLKNRSLLRAVMEKHGFAIYEHEWWHYNFKGWKDYQLLDITFKDLEKHP